MPAKDGNYYSANEILFTTEKLSFRVLREDVFYENEYFFTHVLDFHDLNQNEIADKLIANIENSIILPNDDDYYLSIKYLFQLKYPIKHKKILLSEKGLYIPEEIILQDKTVSKMSGYPLLSHSYYDYFPEKEFQNYLIENNIQQYLPIIKDDSDNWKILGIPFFRITIDEIKAIWETLAHSSIEFGDSILEPLIDRAWIPDESGRLYKPDDIYIDDLHSSLQYNNHNLLGKLGLQTRLEAKREELYDEGYYLLSEEEYDNIPASYRWELDSKFYYNDEEIEDDDSCCNFPQEESY